MVTDGKWNPDRYYVERNGSHDWRVYAVSISGGRGECYGTHTTRNGAFAQWNRLMSVR